VDGGSSGRNGLAGLPTCVGSRLTSPLPGGAWITPGYLKCFIARAVRVGPSRASSWVANSMMFFACWSSVHPKTSAMPCSAATAECWKLVIGSGISGTMVETFAFGCHDGSAMNAWS
jgi:hypothetical protein